jgi:hypothetical protein
MRVVEAQHAFGRASAGRRRAAACAQRASSGRELGTRPARWPGASARWRIAVKQQARLSAVTAQGGPVRSAREAGRKTGSPERGGPAPKANVSVNGTSMWARGGRAAGTEHPVTTAINHAERRSGGAAALAGQHLADRRARPRAGGDADRVSRRRALPARAQQAPVRRHPITSAGAAAPRQGQEAGDARASPGMAALTRNTRRRQQAFGMSARVVSPPSGRPSSLGAGRQDSAPEHLRQSSCHALERHVQLRACLEDRWAPVRRHADMAP